MMARKTVFSIYYVENSGFRFDPTQHRSFEIAALLLLNRLHSLVSF